MALDWPRETLAVLGDRLVVRVGSDSRMVGHPMTAHERRPPAQGVQMTERPEVDVEELERLWKEAEGEYLDLRPSTPIRRLVEAALNALPTLLKLPARIAALESDLAAARQRAEELQVKYDLLLGASEMTDAELQTLVETVAERLTAELIKQSRARIAEAEAAKDAAEAEAARLREANDHALARIWALESALKSATAILDGEMGDWADRFYADWCVIAAAAKVQTRMADGATTEKK